LSAPQHGPDVARKAPRWKRIANEGNDPASTRAGRPLGDVNLAERTPDVWSTFLIDKAVMRHEASDEVPGRRAIRHRSSTIAQSRTRA
jgi:hypothetical protein